MHPHSRSTVPRLPASFLQIADFGVARIIGSGSMTAETGTYRWMAPEVIEHKPYGEKADVFSFAIVIWELLTCKVRLRRAACGPGRWAAKCSQLCAHAWFERLLLPDVLGTHHP